MSPDMRLSTYRRSETGVGSLGTRPFPHPGPRSLAVLDTSLNAQRFPAGSQITREFLPVRKCNPDITGQH